MKTVFLVSLSVFLSLSIVNCQLSWAQSPEASLAAKPFQLIGGKAVIGKVLSIVDKTITLDQNENGQIDLTTTEVTRFIKLGRKIHLKDLKTGDTVVAVGALAVSENTFLVKTLIVKPKVLKVLEKLGVYGTVTNLSENSFTLTSPNRPTLVEVGVTSQTVFRRLNKKIKFAQLQVGDRLVAVALKESNGDLTGRLVVMVASKAAGSKEATPSSL